MTAADVFAGISAVLVFAGLYACTKWRAAKDDLDRAHAEVAHHIKMQTLAEDDARVWKRR